jgi:hypothetical protein
LITPEKTSELLPALRVRHKTKFGHIHVTVVVDLKKDQELEVFAQVGRAGDQTYSDLEGMCRLASLFLRSGGSLALVTKQLLGIGSNISLNGESVSVANSLGEALKKYLDFKAKHGLKSLILGEAEIPEEQEQDENNAGSNSDTERRSTGREALQENSSGSCQEPDRPEAG